MTWQEKEAERALEEARALAEGKAEATIALDRAKQLQDTDELAYQVCTLRMRRLPGVPSVYTLGVPALVPSVVLGVSGVYHAHQVCTQAGLHSRQVLSSVDLLPISRELPLGCEWYCATHCIAYSTVHSIMYSTMVLCYEGVP